MTYLIINRWLSRTVWLTGLFSLCLLASAIAQVPPAAILGEWQSAKKDSRIVIEKQGTVYSGKIVWGTGQATTDEKNPNPALRNRNIIGLVILNDFVYDGDDTFKDGTIYDPREGKTYACKMSLKDAKHLSIRGYVGLSLFGRSEVWTKLN